MTKQFALDLKVARRKAGLSQQDCAHLLDMSPTRMSNLESGKIVPSLLEVCALSVLHGKSFESLFGGIMSGARQLLREQLASLPTSKQHWVGTFNRQGSLVALASRISDTNQDDV